MNTAYSKIVNIDTLADVLLYLKSIKNKSDVSVWLDWDENLINSKTDQLIEPEVTKELFKYMLKHRIHFAIITGRFHDTACNESKRNIFHMQNNITQTIYPTLKILGVDINRYATDRDKKNIYRIYDEKKKCVGILYMGIVFSHEKGAALKNYLAQAHLEYPIKVFVDDYEPYLIEATSSVSDIVAFRRHVPYL